MPRTATAKTPPETAPEPELEQPADGIVLVPLQNLYIHPLNPRSSVDEAEIATLADSIRTAGLLQNLMGLRNVPEVFENPAHTIGIVAGGRRLRAIQRLAASGEWTGPVPVRLTDDEAMARQWAGTENEARQALHPADEIRAYGQMRAAGATTPQIAAAFAVTERHVQRRLALAGLPEPVIHALRKGDITLDVAQTLTLCSNPKQAERLAKGIADRTIARWNLREIITNGSVSLSDPRVKYLGLDAIEAEGIEITRDLFEERSFIANGQAVKDMAERRARDELELIRAAEGWSWAAMESEIVKRGTLHPEVQDLPEADAARYDELADREEAEELSEAEAAELEALHARTLVWTDEQKDRSGITASFWSDGLQIRRGVLRDDDAQEDTPQTTDGATVARRIAPEAAMPQNLKDELRTVRIVILQDALSRSGELAARLLSAQLSGTINSWDHPFALDAAPRHTPEIEGLTVPADLQSADDEPKMRPQEAFAISIEAAAPSFVFDLTNRLARRFCRHEGAAVDAIIRVTPPNARDLWRPTLAGFWKRVSQGYLDAVWRELVPDTGSTHDGFLSLSKKEKAKALDDLFTDPSVREAMGLSREQSARIDAWAPEDLRFSTPAEEGDAA